VRSHASNLFNGKRAETCDGAFHGGSLVSLKACACCSTSSGTLSPARSSNPSPRWRQSRSSRTSLRIQGHGHRFRDGCAIASGLPRAPSFSPLCHPNGENFCRRSFCLQLKHFSACSPVDSIQETTCTMVGKPLDVLPLSFVSTPESDTPSGYCSNPHVPTVISQTRRHQRLASLCRTLS